MQCYQTLAAAALVARELDRIPGVRHRLPYPVIADWMAENDIEADEVLFGEPDRIMTRLAVLARQSLPAIRNAA